MGARCVWRLHLPSHEVVKWVRTDCNPNTCRLTPDGTVLAVSNRGPNGPNGYLAVGNVWGSVLLFDTETGATLDSIIGGNQCTALDISPDGALLAFSDFRDDTVRVYRLPTLEVLRAAGWPRRDLHTSDLVKPK